MATFRKSGSYGRGRGSKNHEHAAHHFVHVLDCCKTLLDNDDQQGELPIMSELFAFRCPSMASKSYPSGGFASLFVESDQSVESEIMNQLPVKYKKNRRRRAMQTSHLGEESSQHCRRRRHEREECLGTGTLRTSAKEYALHPKSSLLLARSDEQDVRASQVDRIEQKRNISRIEFKDPSVTNEKIFNNHSPRTLDDDEFSLHHWMNFGCIQNDCSKSGHWDHQLPSNARRLGSSEKFRRSSTAISPSRDVFELTNRALRKSSRKKKCSKYSKQSYQTLSSSVLNRHNDCVDAHNHPLASFTCEGPMFVPQKHTIKGKKSKSNHLDDFCQTQSALSRDNFQTSGTSKAIWGFRTMPTSLSSSTHQRTQGFLQNDKQSSLHDDLFVSELCGSRCNNSYQGAIRKKQRKHLPDSTRNGFACGPSEVSRKNCGPSKKVHESAERDLSKCTRKVQNVKEAGAKHSQTKGGTTSKDIRMCVEARERRAKDSTGKSAFPDRLVTETGCGQIQFKVQAQDGLARNPQGGGNMVNSLKRTRSLSQKYRPRLLKDLIGQNLVAHALSNAISNGKVAPVYLFQGPPGTGKTSAARIFAAALNCPTLSGDKKPCGLCSECTAFISGKTSGFWELDAASYNGITHIKELIQSELSSTVGPRYKIIILDECHVFSHETWTTLLKLLEELPGNVVIILITTLPDKLPPVVVSRCQKFHFWRIKQSDIVDRLDTVMKLEKLDAEPGALNLIASKSDGSLRNAETVLEQLSLLEQRITLDTIHQLVGSVSDDKLLSLLNMALRSDTISIVQRTRDLVDSGVEPLDLMAQLSTLITNILGGSYIPMNANQDKGCLSMHALADLEMKRLQTALEILSEAEKQLKGTSQYRITWLTAALLHIGSCSESKSLGSASSSRILSASSATQSNLKNRKVGKKRVLEVKRGGKKRNVLMGQAFEGESFSLNAVGTSDLTQLGLESGVHSVDYSCLQRKPTPVAQFPSFNEGVDLHVKSPRNLETLWLNMLKCCTPLSLRQLLQDHGKLLAVSFSAVKVVAHLKIEKHDPKLKAGFYNTCIVNSFKEVLGRPVEVEISLPPALCSAGSIYAPAASWEEDVTQSTSKPCGSREVVKLQNERVISDVKSIQSQGCENDLNFNSACFSPAVFVPHVASLVEPELASLSSSTLLVVKKHYNVKEAAGSEQQRPKFDFSYNAKCPLQTAVDCCLQNITFARNLQIEALKEGRQLRKPMAGPHAQKCSSDGSFASLKHGDSTQVFNHAKENLVLEPQWKCGGLLCWR